ncbi:DUF305 domain-containing protein [Paramixta manurensis]|uniref:DUF305 domain-containing protein n=1 Tax=Paramixta manurensis TaxID=2740817 RepID=A0A6M8UBL6_9GAMM|nr:DUF305 domain-containing protein [Erwiniaceae bacterium PD-1]
MRTSVRYTLPLCTLLLGYSLSGSAHQAMQHTQNTRQTAQNESAFMQENQQAMDQMMAGMSVKASGDVDRDFVTMMIAHHEGAIAMAQSELRYGHNVPLRRIAQEIIVTQQQEIAAMRQALGDALPASTPAPDQINHANP